MRCMRSLQTGTAATVVALMILSGCGSEADPGSATDRPRATASDQAARATDPAPDMEGMDMGGTDTPSTPARMICSAEIQDSVRRTFAMPEAPGKSESWSRSSRIYSCTYQVPGGDLRLSVQDALDVTQGEAYFRGLRARLPSAHTIRGMASFAFPAVETPDGKVAFLKDGKSLMVDASSLKAADLPAGYTSAETAYSVAAAVIACWSE